MHACRVVRAVAELLSKSFIPRPIQIIGSSGWRIEQCRNKSKWEKMRSKNKAAIPQFDYSGDNTLDFPVQLHEDENIFTKIGISNDEIAEFDRPVCSIQIANANTQKELMMFKVLDKFARDPTDTNSLEVQVAKLTLHIRKAIVHMQQFPKDKLTKSRLVEMIHMRRKKLKYLLSYDEERFKWVCKELELTYTPLPEYPTQTSRRVRMRRAAIVEMMEMKESKLTELKDSLTKEREDYYQKKAEVLDAIRMEQDLLAKEAEELRINRIQTGYPGDNGTAAYRLAHIRPIDKVKWWRKHPEILKRKYGSNANV